MKTAPHLSASACTRRIADLQRKITQTEQAKQRLQQHVQTLHRQYTQGLLSYEAFEQNVQTFLQGRSIDAWLTYYDTCIKVYQEHRAHYTQQLTRREERSTNIKYLSIFLILALTLGLFLFVPYFQFVVFPTGAITTNIQLNQTIYTTSAVMDDLVFGRSNVTIVFYNSTGGPDFLPENTTINITLYDIARKIVNTSAMNISQFILNSTLAYCLNYTTGTFADVNNTWALEGQTGYGYGYNATIAASGSSCNYPNIYTVNLTKFFYEPRVYAPATVGFYNLSVNITIDPVMAVTNFTVSFIVDNNVTQWYNATINDTRIFLPNNLTIMFNTTWVDDLNLDGYIFSINMNETTYKNSTLNYFGRDNYSKTYNQSINQTFVYVPRGGTNVTWFFFANDSAGRHNATFIQSFIVNTPPNLTDASILPATPRANIDNLTVNTTGLTDADLDNITINYNWYVNNRSITVLNMPMTNALYSNGRNTTFDFSGYNHYGRVGDEVTARPLYVQYGIEGGAYDFDGTNDNITINDAPGLYNFTGNFTLEAWVNITTLPADGIDTILQKGTDTTGYALVATTSGIGFSVDAIQINATGVVANSWYHLVGVWNGTNCAIYLNASLMNITACTAYTTTVQNLVIGDGTSTPYDGLVDEIRIYNRSLTAQQIGAIYNAGISGRPYYNITVTQETRPGEVWTVNVTVIDADGLNSTTTHTAKTVTIDLAPEIRLRTPINATNTTADAVNFTFTVNDDFGFINATLYGDWFNYIFKVNNTNRSTLNNGFAFENSINVSNMPEGNWTWNIQVCDISGNCPLNNTNYTITVDRTAPGVNNSYPFNNTYNDTNSFISFYYSVNDTTSIINNCTLILNNTQEYTVYSPVRNTDNNISLTLANGQYNWTVRCINQVGLVGNSTYFNFSVASGLLISCSISDEIFNISFGDNVQQNTVVNASVNFRGYNNFNASNITNYNISTSSTNTVNVNISISGLELFAVGLRPIGIGNVSWNSTTVRLNAENTSMIYPGKRNITRFPTFDWISVAENLAAGSTSWIRFWLNVPSAQQAGSYRGNVTLRCSQGT